ncbi:MAG TPA: ATP-binding protein [Thermoanaerobaculia bacterium]|jgi:anti-sigma regulatory factor (Ser/Thr protein kinase)|nr:ATP-binding protein [Thermoanaerobaculia bacterium]
MTATAERQMELTLPMIPDIEIAAARAAGNLARELGMASESIDEMAHAMIEACINAREHSGSADKRIYVKIAGASLSEGNSRIDIWISDRGRGFDVTEARTRRQKLGSVHKRGWGLQIIEAHMDEVSIETSTDGTTIHMVKYGRRSE